jgi:hypothetical protein
MFHTFFRRIRRCAAGIHRGPRQAKAKPIRQKDVDEAAMADRELGTRGSRRFHLKVLTS